jgi:hypothetical protein
MRDAEIREMLAQDEERLRRREHERGATNLRKLYEESDRRRAYVHARRFAKRARLRSWRFAKRNVNGS